MWLLFVVVAVVVVAGVADVGVMLVGVVITVGVGCCVGSVVCVIACVGVGVDVGYVDNVVDIGISISVVCCGVYAAFTFILPIYHVVVNIG